MCGNPYSDQDVTGGSVPGILFHESHPEHIGTLDIDIELNPEKLGDYGYVDLVRELEAHGYERNIEGLRNFQMRRRIQVDADDPIPVIIDLLMPKNAQVKQREEKIVDGLHVQRIDGGEIALEYAKEIRLTGTMPNGTNNDVDILVATIPALLVMKGYAIVGRDKEKDAYDIWFSIRNSEPNELAEECRALLANPIAVQGFKYIARKFQDRESFGPQTVRRFLSQRPDQQGVMDLDQIQTDAHLRVQKWYLDLGIGD